MADKQQHDTSSHGFSLPATSTTDWLPTLICAGGIPQGLSRVLHEVEGGDDEENKEADALGLFPWP